MKLAGIRLVSRTYPDVIEPCRRRYTVGVDPGLKPGLALWESVDGAGHRCLATWQSERQVDSAPECRAALETLFLRAGVLWPSLVDVAVIESQYMSMFPAAAIKVAFSAGRWHAVVEDLAERVLSCAPKAWQKVCGCSKLPSAEIPAHMAAYLLNYHDIESGGPDASAAAGLGLWGCIYPDGGKALAQADRVEKARKRLATLEKRAEADKRRQEKAEVKARKEAEKARKTQTNGVLGGGGEILF